MSESPKIPDISQLEKTKQHKPDEAILDVAMSLSKEDEKDLPIYENAMYLAWVEKKEALADVDNESEDRDKARLDLDLDRLEILITAGFIEEARSVAAEVFEALEATKYEDLFERFYDLDESLSS